MNTPDYLDALRAHWNLPSDYALAKKLGLSRARLSQYRTGHTGFDDYMCARVADILGLPHLEVIANIQAAREKRPEVRDYWRNLARRASATAASVILSLLVLGGSGVNSTAYAVLDNSSNIHYTKLRRWLRRLARLCLYPFSQTFVSPGGPHGKPSQRQGRSSDIDSSRPGTPGRHAARCSYHRLNGAAALARQFGYVQAPQMLEDAADKIMAEYVELEE